MKYLLDSDTLIRAKNDSYPFDSCPAFWTWLEKLNQSEVVFSIDRIKQELIDEGDQLSHWAKMRGSAFFLKTDGAETTKCLKLISGWVYLHERYEDSAKAAFLSAGDYHLVGHAMATGSTVVTFESDAPESKSSIKIPSACKQFNVKCINLWGLRKIHPMKFVLE